MKLSESDSHAPRKPNVIYFFCGELNPDFPTQTLRMIVSFTNEINILQF